MSNEYDMAKELKKVDVVAVGVGFAGGIALAECAKAGLSVVGLERGDRRGVEDFRFYNYGLIPQSHLDWIREALQ